MPANANRGSDDNALATLCSAWGGCSVTQCGCRPIQKVPIEKARGRFPGAGSKILAMMKICR
jgi:hypothetical protein